MTFSCNIKDSLKFLKTNADRTKTPSDSIIKSPEVRAISTKARQHSWDVKKLPIDLPSISKPSQRLQKYYNNKETSHNNVLKSMETDIENANYEFESNYRRTAELIKQYLKLQEEEVESILSETLFEPRKAVIYTNLKLKDIPSVINNYDKYTKCRIENFYNSVLDLERARCENYKRIYKKAYCEITAISHMMPFEVQQYFEFEINAFNEILLQNYRCYAEVNMMLNTRIEDNKTQWFHRFNRNKVKWSQFLKTHGENYSDIVSELDPRTLESQESSEIDKRYDILFTTFSTLDEYMDNAIRKCKYVIVQIFYGSYENLQHLDVCLSIPMNANSIDQMMQLKMELNLIMAKVKSENLLESMDDEAFNDIIRDLEDRLKSTEVFLECVSTLWNAHYIRAMELDHIVQCDLQNLMDKNDLAIEATEVQLIIYYDTCRSAPTFEIAKKFYGYVVAMLTKFAAAFDEHKAKEHAILTHYMDLVETESNILIAEINRFTKSQAPNYEFPIPEATKQSDTNMLLEDWTGSILTIQDHLSYAGVSYGGDASIDSKKPEYLRYFDARMNCLENWKFGVVETLSAKIRIIKEELAARAKKWSSVHATKINNRFKEKISVNKNRFYRIWLTNYYMRYIELKQHIDRFERHKQGVVAAYGDLYKHQQTLLDEITALVDNAFNTLNLHETEMNNTKSRARILAMPVKVKKLTMDLQNDVTKLLERFTARQLICQNTVQHSNVLYLKNIKMFSESGNFDHIEVNQTTEELQKLGTELLRKCESLQKEFQTNIAKITIKFHSSEASFNNLASTILEESNFIETIKVSLIELQREIKRLAYNLKYKRKIVKAFVNDAESYAKLLNGAVGSDEIRIYGVKCLQTVRNFEELYFLLNRNVVEDTAVNNEKTNVRGKTAAEHLEVGKSDQKINTETSRSKSSLTKQSFTDLNLTNSGILLESKTNLTNCDLNEPFHTSVVRLLQNNYEKMRNIARSFYTTVNGILSKDQIEANFEEFQGNLIAKCAYFQLQCDGLWIEEAMEYAHLSATFRNAVAKTYTDFIETAFAFNRKSFVDRFNMLHKKMSHVEVDCYDNIKDIHRRLKPLHGYPKNKNLLEVLEAQFMRQLDDYVGIIEETIGDFKMEHTLSKETIVESISGADNLFRKLLAHEKLQNINRDLFSQILNLFTDMQQLKSANFIARENNTVVANKVADEKLNTYKNSLAIIPIPKELVIMFSVSTIDIVKNIPTNNFYYDESLLELGDMAAFSKSMDYKLDNHLEMIYNFERNTIDDVHKWKDIWNNDIKIIKNLYTVKYNLPNK